MKNSDAMKVIFTIDTEHGCGGIPYKITGDLSKFGVQENYGIQSMMDIFEKYNMRVVFFTNIYEAESFDESNKDIIVKICKEIHERKHEVGLHWHALPTNQTFFRSASPSRLNLEEQKEMLIKGRDYIQEIIGTSPVSFRAGAYRINDYTLEALSETGFLFDSSYWWKNNNNDVSEYKSINKCYKYKKVVEFPVISVVSQIGKHTKLDLDALSLEEIVEVLHILRKRGFWAVQMMFHSYSFLKRSEDEAEELFQCGKLHIVGGDDKKKNKLERLCSYLQLSPEFEVVTFKDIIEQEMNFEQWEDGIIDLSQEKSEEKKYCLELQGNELLFELFYEAESVCTKYAVYLYRDDEVIIKVGYSEQKKYRFIIENSGIYKVKAYIDNGEKRWSFFTRLIEVCNEEETYYENRQ